MVVLSVPGAERTVSHETGAAATTQSLQAPQTHEAWQDNKRSPATLSAPASNLLPVTSSIIADPNELPQSNPVLENLGRK